MNIFLVDKDPVVAAQALPDAHIRKMPIETVQMLVSGLARHDITHDVLTKAGTVHKGGYKNHPSTRWCGDTRSNWLWLLAHGFALCDEFEHRYGKQHFAATQMDTLTHFIYDMPAGPFTEPWQAMPDELKGDDFVEAYRRCIRWKREQKPGVFIYAKDWTRKPDWIYD